MDIPFSSFWAWAYLYFFLTFELSVGAFEPQTRYRTEVGYFLLSISIILIKQQYASHGNLFRVFKIGAVLSESHVNIKYTVH